MHWRNLIMMTQKKVQLLSQVGICLIEMVEINQSELEIFSVFNKKAPVCFLHSLILHSNPMLNSSSFLSLAVT